MASQERIKAIAEIVSLIESAAQDTPPVERAVMARILKEIWLHLQKTGEFDDVLRITSVGDDPEPNAYLVTDLQAPALMVAKLGWKMVSRLRPIYRTERGSIVKIVSDVNDVMENPAKVAVCGSLGDFLTMQKRALRRRKLEEVSIEAL
ncbi:hypothetical protein Hden_2988 [Hyphomicrobium denitrificans ATCC 51888]|uniref:Uncharacterized protein n=1 Tax=Hyphomicrobium denitrificans (strain ATCC 51888 / DSM 1869 / NCIMB 11706 / TK 0415) TaxID=582899 RepID=D8JVC9_HYPDA|nr:hypothetical protein [Hyphomicrobium denitrificans]ADJ24783.1 hypothetical protein Hden_2988 [Hyphomicrobium denitrificans ATCC 51888]